MQTGIEKSSMTRRDFVRQALCLAAAGAVLPAPLEVLGAQLPSRRKLSFYHTHTNEELHITYADRQTYDPTALRRINRFLRDHRTGEVHAIDPALLDILHAVRRAGGGNGVFEVISGYRSPKTNAMLRNKSGGVARRSLHMDGRAIDVRLDGMRTGKLRQIALELQGGGVGYYPKSNFVHLDTGRFRTW